MWYNSCKEWYNCSKLWYNACKVWYNFSKCYIICVKGDKIALNSDIIL